MLAMPGVDRSRDGWAAEPKLDGWRAIVTVDGGLEVRSRTGRFISHIVPELQPLADLGHRMVLDGELIAFDDEQRLDFYALSQRMISKRATRAVTLCVFDVLWLDGHDCSQLAYRDRRRVLDMLELSGPTWCTVPSFAAEDLDALLNACSQLGQEGIVCKQLDSRYLPGVRSKAWRKAKTTHWKTTEAPRRLPAEVRAQMEAAE
jgi:bifunctional non-homologous end joining protein LigD